MWRCSERLLIQLARQLARRGASMRFLLRALLRAGGLRYLSSFHSAAIAA